VREFLSSQSWDKTWNSMQRLMTHHAARKRQIVERRADATVLTPEASAAPV
jgi:hypothetical protein